MSDVLETSEVLETGNARGCSEMAVAVVSYNTRELLRRCLESVAKEKPPMVTVVDHGSSDGSVEMVATEFPDIDLVVDETNPGFGAGANRAIRRSGTPYVLLLNADTEVWPGALEAMTAYLDAHPRCAILGPKLVYPDGRLQPSCAPFLGTFQWQLEKTVFGRTLARIRFVRNRFLVSLSDHDRARRVPWVMGAALAIRREAFEELGGFDTTYFMYAEEVDLCYRAAAAGWEVHFAPVATISHVWGASTPRERFAAAERRLRASILKFYELHYSPQRAWVFGLVAEWGALIRLLKARLRSLTTRDDALKKARDEEVRIIREGYLEIKQGRKKAF